MNCELRKLKIYPRLSKETTAFNAELWIDGKKAADVENDGGGGMNIARFVDRDLGVRFTEYCKSLPPEPDEYGPLPMNDDFFLSLLVEKEAEKQQLAKLSKKAVVFTLPDDAKGILNTVKFQPGKRPAAEKYVREKYPKATIVA